MKLTKKIIVPVAIVAALGIAAAVAVPVIVSGSAPKAAMVSASPLVRMNLENIVSVTGTVKSEDETNVYSTLAYQVKQVNVKVGDTVTEGDVLCEIDQADLLERISLQTASLTQAQERNQYSVAVAEKNLATEEFNQEYGYDGSVTSAEQAVRQAEKTVSDLELDLRSTMIGLSNTRREYKEHRETTGYDPDKSGNTYDPEGDRLRTAIRQGELTITKLDDAIASAKKAVEDAKANLTAVKVRNQEAIVNSQDAVNNARLNADMTSQWMELDALKKDLEDAVVKAPVSGTVTAVLANEGSAAQGLLFVIENTGKLKIDTKIKEYDYPEVEQGQETKIKSDGTGDEEYEGKISKIAPTAIKTAQGSTQETTDVEFAVEVGVSGATKLKIGMNARVDIITASKPDVFAVQYDAVVAQEDGQQAVFVARQAEASATAGDSAPGMVAVAIPVTTGLETDLYIEIISDALKEGDLIISDPSDLTDGQAVALDEASGGAAGNRPVGPGGPRVRVGG